MFQNSDLKDLTKKSNNIKILYVEDDKQTREHLSKFLNLIFSNIFLASDGKEALEIFKEKNIDLLITDITMPKMNGLELIEKVRAIKHNLPTLIISAHNDQETMIKAIKAGIDGFIFKPFDLEQFLDSIKKVIQRVSLIKENEKNLMVLKQYKEITNKSSIISKTDPAGIITFVNKNFCEISGYTKEELIGSSHNIVRHPDNPKDLFKNLWNTISVKKKSWKGIIRNISKSGKSYFVKSTIKPLLDQDGNIIEYMALRDDVTEIMSEKKQLLASVEAYETALLVLIQIENFDILDKFYDSKSIEKIEYTFGNTLMSLFPQDTLLFERIYKLGDGLFAVSCEYNNLLENKINMESYLTELIKNAKKATINLENIEYDISVGVSYCYGKKNTYENAKYGIEKAFENNKSLIFANNLVDEASKIAKRNIETINMVKKALDNYKIISYFQPIIDNNTNEIIKYESLVRLIDEDEKIVSPYVFLDISKKGTYYTKITKRVIENSFKVLEHINHDVSINISVLDIENKALRETLIDLVSNEKYKGRVTFELLEDENAKDFKLIKDFISHVKNVGEVKIAIDDFGSGYSNFERLLDYTPDILKIDGSLIKNIESDIFSKNLVETIVSFAKKQNIKTIAEFVENENIFNILKEMGVDYSQGYYFGKPEKLI